MYARAFRDRQQGHLWGKKAELDSFYGDFVKEIKLPAGPSGRDLKVNMH